MSLKEHYERIMDMPMAGSSEDKHMGKGFARLVWCIIAFVFKICFRYRVDGRENLSQLKGKTGVLVIANHTSFLDVAFGFIAAKPVQWVRYMARDALFKKAHGIAGWVIAKVGAFPVTRDSADLSAVKRAVRFLKAGEFVELYPEGTRRNKGNIPPKLHSGMALIAKMAKVPIVPSTCRNAEYIKMKGERLRFKKVTIEYGEPWSVSDFDYVDKKDRMDACTWYLMRECYALSREVDPDQVDMCELFPEDKDFSDFFRDNPPTTRNGQAR